MAPQVRPMASEDPSGFTTIKNNDIVTVIRQWYYNGNGNKHRHDFYCNAEASFTAFFFDLFLDREVSFFRHFSSPPMFL